MLKIGAKSMRAIERLATILEAVASSPHPVAPTAVMGSTGLSLSTAARLMQQLAEASLLTRDSHSGTYTLGPRVFAIAHAGMHQFGLRTRARSILERLRDRSGETATLHIRAGSQRICIDQVPSNHSHARLITVGSAHPLIGSATGDVLLAYAAAPERERLIASLGVGDPEPSAVQGDIERTVSKGYSLSVNRWAQGVVSVAAPVLVKDIAVGALAVSGPVDRFTAERASAFAPELVAAASELAAGS